MDRLENIKISENVTLRVVRTDKFKTIFIGASFLWPLLKEDHTKNALIPRVLLRGCEEYPDMRSLSGKLADMYGASLSPFVSKKGDLQEFGLYMSFISDRYALKNEKIEKDAVELLLKVLFSPALENGAFLSKTIDSEKKNLEDTIKNRINDKIPYSMARCVEEMAGKESYGIFEEGSLIDLPQINPKNLYEHYEEILKNAPIEIFVYGELSKEGVNEIVDALRQKKSLRRSIKSKVAQPKEKAIEVVEKIPAEQSKLCVSYTTGISLSSKEYPSLAVMNAVFGGTVTSKLFMNVREKQSLCYFIASRLEEQKGYILACAGIDTDKKEITLESIRKELQDIKNGKISDLELDGAKKGIINSLNAAKDSPLMMMRFYSVRGLIDSKETIDEYKAKIEKVTMEDVVSISKTVKEDTVYFLCGESGGLL